MDGFFSPINAVLDQLPAWVTAVTALVTGATALTMITPTTVDNRLLATVLRLLNIVAGNVGKNKNADDK